MAATSGLWWSSTPVYQDGTLIGFAKITRDMTEQREAQLAALESERRFRLLVERVTDYAIYMLSPEGRMTNWNAGAERIKGYAASEIIGQHFSRFYTAEDIAAGLPEMALATARRDGHYEAEGWRCRKDGSRFWASAVVDAIYDEGKLIGFAKITRDLTERRDAQIAVGAITRTAVPVAKDGGMGQLTGGMAHDFNNLLTGITGSLELMKRRVAQGRIADLERFMTAAQDAASRAAVADAPAACLCPPSNARSQADQPKPVNRQCFRNCSNAPSGRDRAGNYVASGLWSALCDPTSWRMRSSTCASMPATPCQMAAGSR